MFRLSLSKSRSFCIAVACIGSLAAPTAGRANDGGISFGGSPGLLKDHASVSMADEVIRITVGKKTMTADCRFVFKNSGPACTVRMGFPDEGYGAWDPDEEHLSDDIMKTPPRTTFDSFRSWVNGHEVGTKLIRAAEEGKYWHTKTVRFPAHTSLTIRDVYTQSLGDGFIGLPHGSCYASWVGYILHTGASWHGPIGRSEVDFTFRGPHMPERLKLVARADITKSGNAGDLKVEKPARGSVVWLGPCKPTASGRTVQFIRTNWRPTKNDDIELRFDYQSRNHE